MRWSASFGAPTDLRTVRTMTSTPNEPLLRIRDLRKQFGHNEVLKGIDLDVFTGDRIAVLGASGSGKSTLLRCINFMETPSSGTIEIAGQVIGTALPERPGKQERRYTESELTRVRQRAGMVFQQFNLFPHLTVLDNLQYGLQRSAAATQRDLDPVVDLLGIGSLLSRKPDALSGGERQRVGIARALAVRPSLLLMDEPLAALDLRRKQEILPYLDRLQQELDIPILYVTHSPDEVARLASHIVVLEQGRLVTSGPLAETLARLDLPIRLGDDLGVVIES